MLSPGPIVRGSFFYPKPNIKIMKKVTVAIQGSIGSFHDQVAAQFFEGNLDLLECETFEDSFKALANQQADYTVVAVENTIYGPISSNYKLIEDYRFRVSKEIQWKIELHLMALPGTTIDAITEVHSHPIALAQCSNYLNKLTGVSKKNAANTAKAAQEIAKNQAKNYAAIANTFCAQLYGLEIIEKYIQNEKEDYTRFLLLERNNSPKSVLELVFPTIHHMNSIKTSQKI